MKVPISGISQLSKSIIQINGPDATKFLNGLVTTRLLPNVVKKKEYTISEVKHAELAEIINIHENWGLMHEDIYDPDNNILIRRDGINSMFLNSKGRIINDCFLYSQPFHNFGNEFDRLMKEPNYLIEIDSSFSSQLLMLFNLHKLSAKVNITKQSSIYSYYYYNDTIEFDHWLDQAQGNYFQTFDPINALQNSNSFIKNELLFNKKIANDIVGFSIDNRIPNFGIKFLTTKPITTEVEHSGEKLQLNDIFCDNFKQKFSSSMTSEESITRRRYLNGLFEIQDAPKGTSLLPFEANLDYINGLSLDKGCYVGQELTIRTFNNGTIRKRILPVQFFGINDESIKAMRIHDHNILNPSDSIIEDVKHINKSAITKLNISPLVEETNREITDESSQTSFGSSPFGISKITRRRKTSAGKLLSTQDNLGFILTNLSDIENNRLFKVEIPCLEGHGVKTIGIKVFVPDWWPQDED